MWCWQVLEEYTRALTISPSAPWQLQQLLEGREFSCNTVAHAGRVIAHADTEACLSNLYYRHEGSKEVRERSSLARSIFCLLACHYMSVVANRDVVSGDYKLLAVTLHS